MSKTKKVLYQGKEIVAEVLGFVPNLDAGGEKWTLYELTDGTQINLKPVLLSVLRLQGTYTVTGDPVYIIEAGNVQSVDAPDSVRKLGG